MKNGILIYSAADAERNQWFIQHLTECAESERMVLRLCIAEQTNLSDFTEMQPDFAVNRSRYAKFSAHCEDVLHIPVFNSRAVTEITNDKYTTFQFLHGKHGIPMANTFRITNGDMLPELPVPVIAKPADGHGGKGVTLLKSMRELTDYAKNAPRPFLMQEPMVFGWDVRLYVMGGKVCAAVLRTSDTDFRSNFSLGGHAALITPDAEMLALVQQVQQILPLDFAGIDLLRHPGGGYVIGEIEDAVGCRMLYSLTDLDPAADYIRHIRNRLQIK